MDQSIEVVSADDGKRIDALLKERIPGVTRAHVVRQIEKGRVLLNGRPAPKGREVHTGDTIRLAGFLLPGEIGIAPDRTSPLSVLYEDEAVVAVEKEAGLPTLPKDEEDRHALACRLAGRYPELRKIGPPLEAGLLHRLDTPTSGVVVAARTVEAYERLREEWPTEKVVKEYLVLAEGEAKGSFTVHLPVGHHRGRVKRMAAGAGGRRAETKLRLLFRAGGRSLLAAALRGGSRHQIRVHLAASGLPVAGDVLYGPKERGAPRLMLHAIRVRLRTMVGGEVVEIFSDPPGDFLEVVRERMGEEGVRAIREGIPPGGPAR